VIRKHPLCRLCLLCLTLVSASARCLQLVEARDGVGVEAVLSVKEATRIRIDGAPITDVFGNIHSSNCAPPAGGNAVVPAPAVNPDGEIVIECDRDKGEIYVRPVGTSSKPVNLFIGSARATYTLILRRSDTPADTIVIRDPSARVQRPADPKTPGGSAPHGRVANHIRDIKALLTAMASERVPADMRVEELQRPLVLWQQTSFLLLRVFEGRGLIGEKYRLTNVSDRLLVLAEQEFDREDGNVVGVSIESHQLQPGESTTVYVIRSGS
jgi:conjugal transfer pilus assembly protein TraK